MARKWLSIYACEVGHIVAQDIMNDNGVIIVCENTVLNSYIINRLDRLGVKDLCIYETLGVKSFTLCRSREFDAFYKDYEESISSLKELMLGLVSEKSFHKAELDRISKVIHSKIHQKSKVIQYLQLIRASDEYTYSHCINTAFYAMLMAKWLKFSEPDIKKVIQAGLLHDVGKAKLPIEILNKKGNLTKDEYEIIKNHTILGYGMLNDIVDIDSEVKLAALLHHERVDGSGYPFGADPEFVNKYSRIIAVADVYDAMTSDRVYKKRSTPFEAFEMLQTVGVGIFDTSVVHAFLKNMSAYYVGANVMLSDGSIGEIVYVPPQDIICPIISAETGFVDLAQEKELKVVGML